MRSKGLWDVFCSYMFCSSPSVSFEKLQPGRQSPGVANPEGFVGPNPPDGRLMDEGSKWWKRHVNEKMVETCIVRSSTV